MNYNAKSTEVTELLNSAKKERANAALVGSVGLLNLSALVYNISESNLELTIMNGVAVALCGYVALNRNEDATFQNNAASHLHATEILESRQTIN